MKYTTEQFISKAREKHGDKFDYSQSVYKGSSVNIVIICREHGPFSQTPSEHYIGKGGCHKCHSKIRKIMHLSNKNEFIEKAYKIHADKFEYIGEYIKQDEPMLMKCNEHNEEFYMTPKIHLRGCSNCNGCLINKQHEKNLRNSMSPESFLIRAHEVHNKYEYNPIISDYVKVSDYIEVICIVHGTFKIKAGKHLQGQGCVKCGRISIANFHKKCKDDFVKKAIEVHGLKYDYSNFLYESMSIKSEIICPKHGPFQMNANNHINGNGCRPCSRKGFSNISIRWLDFESRSRNIEIQHILNGGEFTVPDTKFRVDGFSQSTNTIFEFHGDYFHGNPHIYLPTFINKLSKKTMGELYENTLSRENKLREYGYEVVTIWEKTWRTVEKAIRKWKKLLKHKHTTP